MSTHAHTHIRSHTHIHSPTHFPTRAHNDDHDASTLPDVLAAQPVPPASLKTLTQHHPTPSAPPHLRRNNNNDATPQRPPPPSLCFMGTTTPRYPTRLLILLLSCVATKTTKPRHPAPFSSHLPPCVKTTPLDRTVSTGRHPILLSPSALP
ncbi:hypothetical protein BDQ17DRAFT_1434430 [Cyathus striatus]|nr:hypothetical protein BDQ17DRAFT_1434430 [Cyathus striatus]